MVIKKLAPIKAKKIAIWGLAFKPDTDDVRDAPSIKIIERLLKAKAVLQAFDPAATANMKKIYPSRISYCGNAYEALKGAHALLILTEWNEFRSPDFRKIKSLLKNPLIFDGRNIYDADDVRGSEIKYFGTGIG
jgi:UDPglucose 6-dehydrogenase